MTSADQFYAVVIALMAAVVLVMVALACAFRVVWLVAEARSSQRMVIDDLDVTEYAAHADDVYDQEAEPDRAVAALRAELDAWGRA
jgi:hypothetical protein